MKRFIYTAIVLMMVSCSEDMSFSDELSGNSVIFGTWVEHSHETEVTVLERAGALDPDGYGFTIREDGTFIERKNSGWCATPPIAYANFEGEWTALSDSLLEINVGYWGGTINYQMRIVSVQQDTLMIRYLYGDNRADYK